MGQQMQVDWGEITVKNQEKKLLNYILLPLFSLTLVINMWNGWTGLFTTRDTIRCHEKAFQFFGGIPKEIVYDQDHLITVSENAGDIILTGEFQAYKQERGFRIYLM